MKLLVALLALVLMGIASAAECNTVTDFSYGALNKESSNLHLTTFRAHFDKGAVHITDKVDFETKPSICLRSIQVAPATTGASMPTVTLKTYYKRYGVETRSKADFTSDATGIIDLGEEHCEVSGFSISVAPGTEAALKSIAYCLPEVAGAVSSGSKKRSVQIRDVEDESVATQGNKPIIPSAYCTGSLGEEGGHHYCLGVFSYTNGNNFTVALDSNHTFFVPASRVFSIAPTNYYAGFQEGSVGAVWRCDPHKDTTLMFSIITPMTNTSIQTQERHDAALIRDFRKHCPEDLLSEFAELDLSELIDGEDP